MKLANKSAKKQLIPSAKTRNSYHLVHANIAIARAPLDHPMMKEFVEQANVIDQIAHDTPGFVSQPSPADEGSVFKDPEILNLSVWKSVESIQNFTFRGKHAAALDRRAEWFVQGEKYNYVLYWDEAGKTPLESEVYQHLVYLRTNGPTPYAFIFDKIFFLETALAYSPK